MGARYNISKQNAALSLSADLLTITAPSGKALKISRMKMVGAGTVSSFAEVGVYRSTGGTTGSGGITPQPKAPGSQASQVVVWTAWAAQPTLGVQVHKFGFNANGGLDAVNFQLGQELEVPPSGQLSIRSIAGTNNAIFECEVEEVG